MTAESATICAIDERLVQGYYLDVDPGHEGEVIEELSQAEATGDRPGPAAGSWHHAVWLGDSSLLSLRAVTETTGHDRFLADLARLHAVQGVSEFVSLQFRDDVRGPVAFAQFEEAMEAPWHSFPIVAIVFVTVNHRLLRSPALQEVIESAAELPGSDARLAWAFSDLETILTVRQAIARASNQGGLTQDLDGALRVAVTLGLGHSDIVCICVASSVEQIDRWLFAVLDIGVDTVYSIHLGPEQVQRLPTNPVVRKSTTEIGVRPEIYELARQGLLGAQREGTRGEARCTSEVRAALEAKLLCLGLYLEQGTNGVTRLRGELESQLLPGWRSEAILGQSDVRLYKAGDPSEGAAEEPPRVGISELLRQSVSLDAWRADQPGRPRRTRWELALAEPAGRDVERTLSREQLYGVSGSADDVKVPRARTFGAALVTDNINRFLDEAHDKRRREDVRIVERMAERCITLLKNPRISQRTRRFLLLFMTRMERLLRHLHELTDLERDILGTARTYNELDSEAQAYVLLHDFDISETYTEIVAAGRHLASALVHMTGVEVDELLRPGALTGPSHLASEVRLLDAVEGVLRSIGDRFLAALKQVTDAEAETQMPKEVRSLFDELPEAMERRLPDIAYAGDEPSFSMLRGIGVVRLPRWVLWYPTKLSYLLHEYAHALMAEANAARYAYFQLGNLAVGDQRTRAVLDRWLHGNRFSALWIERGPSLPDRDQQIPYRWARHFHEVAGDVMCLAVARGVHSYNRVARGCMEYLTNVCRRKGAAGRLEWIGRHFAAYVAARQLSETRGAAPWPTFPAAWGELGDQWGAEYSAELGAWLAQRGGMIPVGVQVGAALRTAVEEFRSKTSDQRYFFELGMLFALCCSVEVVPTEDFSLVKATAMLNAVRIMLTSDVGTDSGEHLAARILAGEVPRHKGRCPERVIAPVEEALYRQRTDVPANTRMALSLFLGQYAEPSV